MFVRFWKSWFLLGILALNLAGVQTRRGGPKTRCVQWTRRSFCRPDGEMAMMAARRSRRRRRAGFATCLAQRLPASGCTKRFLPICAQNGRFPLFPFILSDVLLLESSSLRRDFLAQACLGPDFNATPPHQKAHRPRKVPWTTTLYFEMPF